MITGVNVVGKRNCIANTAFNLPNWAILKGSAASQKTVGQVAIKLGGWHKVRLLFIRLTSGSSFLFEFANFLLIQRVFEPFYNVQNAIFIFFMVWCS